MTQVKTLGAHPEARSDHSATIIKKKMFIFGGISGENQFDDVWSLDLDQHAWAKIYTIGDSPSKRIGHHSTAYREYLLIFGGNNEINYPNTNLWILDTSANTWMKVGDNMKVCSDKQDNAINPEDFLQRKLLKSSTIEK
jgi:Galactose oxidase, central domain